jgi:hypothetical protein
MKDGQLSMMVICFITAVGTILTAYQQQAVNHRPIPCHPNRPKTVKDCSANQSGGGDLGLCAGWTALASILYVYDRSLIWYSYTCKCHLTD